MRGFKISLGVKVFAAIWLLVWVAPPLRESFDAWRVLQGSFAPPTINIARLKTRFPDDPRLLELELLDKGMSGDAQNRKRLLGELDALSRRFPRENWIRADRLRASMWASFPMEIEGETVSKTPLSSSNPRWLSDAEIGLALSRAVEGGKREPDNAFFPWMEAIFRFGLRQSDAAIAALARAAKCPRWNDYTGDETRRRVALYSLQHRLLWEQKVALWGAQLLPHFGPMRQAARAATWQGIVAMRRGDHARALQIFEVVMSASQPLQKSDGSFIGVLVGEAIEREVWERVAKETGAPMPRAWQERNSAALRPEYRLELAQIFASYARKHGREDVAAQAVFDAGQGDSARMSQLTSGGLAAFFGVGAREFRIAQLGAALGALLGFCAFVGAALWSVTAIGERLTASEEFPARGQIALCANFSWWASVIYLAVLLSVGTGGEFLGEQSGSESPYFVTLIGFLPWVLGFSWFLPVAWTAWRRARQPKIRAAAPLSSTNPANLPFLSARSALWSLAAIFFFLICLNEGSRPPILQGTWLERPAAETVFGVALSAALGLEWRRLKWRRARPRRRSIAFRGMALGGTLVLSLMMLFFIYLPPVVAAQLTLALLIVSAALVWRTHRGAASLWVASRWGNWVFAARLAGRSAGVLAVACSVGYVLVALAIWPSRAQLNAAFERRLQIGEVVALREQLALKNPSQYAKNLPKEASFYSE